MRLTEKVGADPAWRIVRKFGGVRKLWELLWLQFPKLDIMTVYRWTYPRSQTGGTGGRIPREKLRVIMEIARRRSMDLELTIEELL